MRRCEVSNFRLGGGATNPYRYLSPRFDRRGR
nr:MAG TPA: hypothetical protein [Caudoviricetes sp.]